MDTKSQSSWNLSQQLQASSSCGLENIMGSRWTTHQDTTRSNASATYRGKLQHSSDRPNSYFALRDKHSVHAKLGDQHVPMAELTFSEQQRQRELRRMRHIRYRKKKENYANSLEEETKQIREEIEMLEKRCRTESVVIPKSQNIWSVVTEYFRLFRHGMRKCELLSSQANFLHSTMAVDVAFNEVHGAQMVIENWKLISFWFPTIEIELECLDKAAAGWFVAITTTTITISEQTLRVVFPHMCTSQDGTVGDKLLGKTIVMRGSARFKRNAANDQISSVVAQSDMLTPMLQILGSLEAVSRLFDDALITPAFQAKLPVHTC